MPLKKGIKILEKNIGTKKRILITCLILFIILIVYVVAMYVAEKDFREWVGIHILGKSITDEDINTINLNIDKSNQIHVYYKYIAILNDKNITLYNEYGEKIKDINVDINTALFNSDNKYLAIAEKNGNEVCLILDKTYLWSNKIDGDILQVHVNQNGYVAIVSKDSTHKSIITMYDSSGKKLFDSYFSSTRVIDISISKDNKYIAMGELDTTGAVIQSNIRIISVENAKSDAENAIIYTYNAESGKLITNVEYQKQNQITCMYDNSVDIIKNEKNEELFKIDNSKITFLSIEFSNYIAYIEEENTGLFKYESNINIRNTENNKSTIYNLKDIAKQVYANDDIIAINVGIEAYFLNQDGWLIKKYTAAQEITNIMFSKEVAAIIYKDKIMIVNL